MNYYKRHLGDYARDTGHLSALEHGVYNLLLDWYYVNEKPIPLDKAVKIARGNPEETQSVLSEFFVLGDAGWTHNYADREIAKYRVKADRNRDVGKLGGRPVKSTACDSGNPEITQMVSAENPDVTLATNPLIHKSKKEQKPLERQAARFGEFWSIYPNKKGKADAEKAWTRKKLDALADTIIADVKVRAAHDRQWLDGYIPHGSTYVNSEGWQDAIEKPRQQSGGYQPMAGEI